MTIKELCKKAHTIAISKGFWGKGEFVTYKSRKTTITEYDNCERNNGELLMLVVSELGECLEYLRHNNPESDKIKGFSGAEEELADAMIRIGDMAEARGWNLDGAIEAKMKYNKTRPEKHGKLF